MENNKLTDSEIVKALGCCNKNDCRTCPYGKYNVTGWCCMPKARKDALDLINRLQAENERLKSHIQEGIDLAKQIPEMLALTKAEAYKEFADKFKKKLSRKYTTSLWKVYCEEIDNLLKELVGEDSES